MRLRARSRFNRPTGRRLAFATLLACLSAAGSAYAAGPVTGGPNIYTGSFSIGGHPGTPAHPAPATLTETLSATSATQGDVAAPIVDIRTSVYGVRPNPRYFPKCTVGEINGAGASTRTWNGVCPKGSLVASGHVQAALTSPSANLAGPGTPCSLGLSAYNGGAGKLTLFFTMSPATCSGLTTGAAAAWSGTVSDKGGYLNTDIPEPPDVSYDAGNIGLFGSLESETLSFKRLTIRHDGRTIPFLESVGCSKRLRPYSVTYTATTSSTPSAANESSATVTGSKGC